MGHQGRLRPVFDGAMGARLRAVPARHAHPAIGVWANADVGTARNVGAQAETSVRRLCPPYRCHLFSIAVRTRATVSAGVRETCSTSAATCSPESGSTSLLDLSASARKPAALRAASKERRG